MKVHIQYVNAVGQVLNCHNVHLGTARISEEELRQLAMDQYKLMKIGELHKDTTAINVFVLSVTVKV